MIVGAGLAGLITAHVFQREELVDSAAGPRQMHAALLRFRSDVVSKLTGIDFRRVLVRKGIFFDGQFRGSSIALANDYSIKCLGRSVGERSIWNLEPVERYIAPESFYTQLLEAVGKRVQWGVEADFEGISRLDKGPVISTAPLPVVLRQVAPGISSNVQFNYKPITVLRFRLCNCDLHQTVYFPSNAHSLYRASITGDLLICELVGDKQPLSDYSHWWRDLEKAFGYQLIETAAEIDQTHQSFGKIAPIDEGLRKEILHKLSVQHGIFSIGRFATWRNILLDDIVNDAAVVKKLIAASGYERRMAAL